MIRVLRWLEYTIHSAVGFIFERKTTILAEGNTFSLKQMAEILNVAQRTISNR